MRSSSTRSLPCATRRARRTRPTPICGASARPPRFSLSRSATRAVGSGAILRRGLPLSRGPAHPGVAGRGPAGRARYRHRCRRPQPARHRGPDPPPRRGALLLRRGPQPHGHGDGQALDVAHHGGQRPALHVPGPLHQVRGTACWVSPTSISSARSTTTPQPGRRGGLQSPDSSPAAWRSKPSSALWGERWS